MTFKFSSHQVPGRSVLALGLLIAGCARASAHTNEHGIDPLNFDTATSPCTDFFQYANGGWLKSNPIPADNSHWNIDDELRERTNNVLREILEDAAQNPGKIGGLKQKAGDFWASAMNEAAIEKAGVTPIKAQLAQVDALKTNADVASLIRQWHAAGDHVGFDFDADTDLNDAKRMVGYASQGGIGLPERDYYVHTDQDSLEIVEKYKKHIERMFRLAGYDNAVDQSQRVLSLEKTLAKASLDNVALRKPNNRYHLYSIESANLKTPHFSWKSYFEELKVANVDKFSLSQPEFFAAFDKALEHTPLETWKAYLRWYVLDNSAPYLSKNLWKKTLISMKKLCAALYRSSRDGSGPFSRAMPLLARQSASFTSSGRFLPNPKKACKN
jgi:putative endopeptidase